LELEVRPREFSALELAHVAHAFGALGFQMDSSYVVIAQQV